MDKLLNLELCAKYPKIFINKEGTPATTWNFECKDGWFELIDQLCESIQNYINDNPNHKIQQVRAEQIKEKYGSLRFYYSGGDELIEGMVWLAGSMSLHICEQCGAKGELRETKLGYYYTTCKLHVEQ